jgi:ubiquinone biosynthesis protein UbiJ
MPGGLRHIKPLLISSIEAALNQYLALDEQVGELLAPLTGKVIAIEITPYDITLYLCPTSHNIQILESFYGIVDARLKGSLSALGFMGLSATPMHALFRGDVKIEGDTETAHKLQRLFAKLDLDPESRLAHYTGENFAHNLSQVFRGSRDWLKHSTESFRLNVEEYFQEETRDLPAKQEAELLFRAIDDCRGDYDRLKARVERLNTRLSGQQPQTGHPQ